jgi:hypothetical protein
MLYRNDPEKLRILFSPVQVDMEKKFQSVELLKTIQDQFPEVHSYPLPIVISGIEFCRAGRFDLVSLLWQEASKDWPYIPDFPFALGFIFGPLYLGSLYLKERHYVIARVIVNTALFGIVKPVFISKTLNISRRT